MITLDDLKRNLNEKNKHQDEEIEKEKEEREEKEIMAKKESIKCKNCGGEIYGNKYNDSFFCLDNKGKKKDQKCTMELCNIAKYNMYEKKYHKNSNGKHIYKFKQKKEDNFCRGDDIPKCKQCETDEIFHDNASDQFYCKKDDENIICKMNSCKEYPMNTHNFYKESNNKEKSIYKFGSPIPNYCYDTFNDQDPFSSDDDNSDETHSVDDDEPYDNKPI